MSTLTDRRTMAFKLLTKERDDAIASLRDIAAMKGDGSICLELRAVELVGRMHLAARKAAGIDAANDKVEHCANSAYAPTPCSAPDQADLIPPWPCQQLHGGRPPYIYQGCDPDTGLCHHEECNPANDDRVPNNRIAPDSGAN